MRLRPDARAALVLAVLLAAPAPVGAQELTDSLPVAEGSRPTREQTAQALAAAQADPNIDVKRTIRTLRWNGPAMPSKEPRSSGAPAWVEWIGGLFSWVALSSRVLVWVIAALLVLFVAVYVVRVVRARSSVPSLKRFSAPTHVRDLDIRPESLPEDVGAAALALWTEGDRRAALALLYRGLLSRLAHVHAVPIRDSSTEGDCLALAAPRLNEPRRAYAARLVSTWRHAVYGDDPPESGAVQSLCAEFSLFDAPRAAERTGDDRTMTAR